MASMTVWALTTGLLVAVVVSSSIVERFDALQDTSADSQRVSSVRAGLAEAQGKNGTTSHLTTYRQCQNHSCPPSQLLEDRGSYKIVFFPSSPYAKSRLAGQTLVPATLGLYARLRGYISGNNVDKRVIPMTAPVILRVDPNGPEGMWSPKNFTLFFYVDPSVQPPPAPTDAEVNVLQVNSYTLFIRTFSGFPVTYGDWMRELLQLVADVEADGEVYNPNFFYFAAYDPPSQISGRINEVQLLKPSRS